MTSKVGSCMCVLVVSATVSAAQDKPKPPSFFPHDEYFRSTECKDPFVGWLDPENAHLVVVTETADFKDYPSATEDLQSCVGGLAHLMVLGGQAHVPIRYELTDTTGRVLQSKTLDLLDR